MRGEAAHSCTSLPGQRRERDGQTAVQPASLGSLRGRKASEQPGRLSSAHPRAPANTQLQNAELQVLECSGHGRHLWAGLTLLAEAVGEGDLETAKETTPRFL